MTYTDHFYQLIETGVRIAVKRRFQTHIFNDIYVCRLDQTIPYELDKDNSPWEKDQLWTIGSIYEIRIV